jgi:cytochrome c oxidase assembly protein subunit 15
LVPPTDVEVLLIAPGKSFHKGQMVIHHDTLWVAQQDVVLDDNASFWNHGSEAQWKKYPKHDYAIFNVWHTWIEYINRLFTGVLGIPVLILLILSFRWAKKGNGWSTFLATGLTLILILYEAWIGKLVVDGHLSGGKVTLHMLGTMGIILTLLWAYNASSTNTFKWTLKRPWLLWVSLFMVIAQIVLGSQLREAIDEVIKAGHNRKEWVAQVIQSSDDIVFYVHRTFSWLVLFTAGALAWELSKQGARLAYWIGLPLVGEFVVGILLTYFDYPIWSQPMHLLLSMILLGALIHLAFRKSSIKSE